MKINILQVIPRLGYGGAETGCYDLAHFLHEQNSKSNFNKLTQMYFSKSVDTNF